MACKACNTNLTVTPFPRQRSQVEILRTVVPHSEGRCLFFTNTPGRIQCHLQGQIPPHPPVKTSSTVKFNEASVLFVKSGALSIFPHMRFYWIPEATTD